MRTRTASLLIAAAAFFACPPGPALADEGMWLLTNPPAALEKDYGFKPDAGWLERMQKAAVRFETGGSGSIVSRDGLVMTNHHVGSDMIAKLSTKERDLMEVGFLARTRAEELPCPDLEVRVLWEIEDVTARVKEAAAGIEDAAEAGAARRRAIAQIEQESLEKSGLTSEVVTLFQGGQYHLYRSKSFTDVRLVFAPEEAAAFFGGDTDNFEYPRYNLDACFFRIYENGEPLKAQNFLEWSPAGAAEDELVFVFGHPGRTRRMYTHAHTAFLRDWMLPTILQHLWRAEVKLQTFAGRSAENARVAREDMLSIANGRKAFTGLLAGLHDPALMDRKLREELDMGRLLMEKRLPEADEMMRAVSEIGEAQSYHAEFYVQRFVLDRFLERGSGLLARALRIVRLAEELPKPSGERLAEYGESRLPALYLDLYSPEPIYDALEIERIASGLSQMAEYFGGDDETVQAALMGESPRARAEQLVKGCTFKDPAARRALVEGGAQAVAESEDPMLGLARLLDPISRALRQRFENEVDGPEKRGYEKLARARFALLGDNVYPDATFTLRLSYGTVKALGEGEGRVPAFTTLAGKFERAAEREGEKEFRLPPSWVEKREKIDLSVPYNFICTADIIGGNSGSPVVNRAGQVVGLVFDGNIDSLVGDVIYDIRTNRAVSVDSRGIVEALRSVYEAKELLAELGVR
ncbi:MAG: S46 family peptidase [Phycisphaeraceae bacterium]|nr:S46 family peptidase [Phycisphaeraceae bacterium]